MRSISDKGQAVPRPTLPPSITTRNARNRCDPFDGFNGSLPENVFPVLQVRLEAIPSEQIELTFANVPTVPEPRSGCAKDVKKAVKRKPCCYVL